MATFGTLRCFSRATVTIPPRAMSLAATFSTTAAVNGTKKDNRKPQELSAKQKRKMAQDKRLARSGKAAEPGQRKAFRKRVQLSNNNAIPIDDLPHLEAGNMAAPESAGRVFRIPDPVIDQLRAVEAFKPWQCWGYFRQPHTMLRGEAVELMGLMGEAAGKNDALRLVIQGGKTTGKSIMLLQAMAYAFLNRWIVISIPEGIEMVNGNTDYSRVPDTEPMQFTQPSYTMKLLQDILRANRGVLSSIKLSQNYSKVPYLSHLNADSTLEDLIEGCKESEFAWPTFQYFWAEVTTVPGRPPVLVAIDGLKHLMRNSEYRDPAFNLVHAHDLVLVRTFTDALSGAEQLVNGGAILGSVGGNQNPASPSADLVLAQTLAAQMGKELPQPDPYGKHYDARVDKCLRGVRVMPIAGATRDETRAVLEYWARSGIFRSSVTERDVVEKWALAGHGVLGELMRVGLMGLRL